MGTSQDWQSDYQRELEQAAAARQAGNEGKARVCARRAAGIAAGEYLQRNGEFDGSWSAYQRLQVLQRQPGLPARAVEIIAHLTARVDTDHNLPVEADLLAEAVEFGAILLGE